MTDSTTAGYLAPLTPALAADIDLDMLLQPAVVGITGMADALVVIKGQPIPPLQPDRSQTWCAIGVTGIDAAANIDDVHDGEAAWGLGESRLFRQEDIEVTASFYGPQARTMASFLRDGIAVGQNRDVLEASGLKFVRTERITGLADFENSQYVRRCDAVLRFRRMVGRTYPIRNIVSLAGEIASDGGDATSPAPVATDLGYALAAIDPTTGV